jgi:LacI family transcriptional regulator
MAAHALAPRVALGWDDTAAVETVLAGTPDLTGIVFINDGYALRWGLPALRAAGRRIPEDISVVAFDNIQEAREYAPPITSAALPFYQISKRAVHVLLEQVRNPLVKSQQIRFHTVLNKRASCARVDTTTAA